MERVKVTDSGFLTLHIHSTDHILSSCKDLPGKT